MHTFNYSDARITSNPEILNEFTVFYKNLLGTPTQCVIRPCLNNQYPQANADHLRQSADPISLQEIKKAVFDLPKDKAVGPDGFPIEFFQQYWSTISGDLYRIITSFYNNELDLWRINKAYISMIPKKSVGICYKFRDLLAN
jgi:hypothetical protein